jgi:hypothetical protein
VTEQIKMTPDRVSARNVAVAILPEQLEQSWPALDVILRNVESWTQCLSADNIRAALMSGNMQLWALLDDHDYGTLAVSQITKSPRGSICTVWLITTQLKPKGDAPLPVIEVGQLAKLIDGIQRFAQHFGCSALEINAHPSWTNKISGKVTAVIIERDLRPTKTT